MGTTSGERHNIPCVQVYWVPIGVVDAEPATTFYNNMKDTIVAFINFHAPGGCKLRAKISVSTESNGIEDVGKGIELVKGVHFALMWPEVFIALFWHVLSK